MQLSSSYADIAQGVRDGTMGGWFDFLVPDFMTSNPVPAASGPSSAPSMVQAAGATPDTGPGFFTALAAGLPSVLTAGLNAFSTTQIMKNPAAAASLLRSYSTPPGVSSPYGPNAIPSGLQLPPGVTPGAYAYPASYYQQAQSFMSGPYALPLIVGGGGLLLFMLMQRKGR